MCIGSTPKAPPAAPLLPEAPRTPEATSPTAATTDERRRRAAAGQSERGTILTSSRGVTNGAQTQQKTLLGA